MNVELVVLPRRGGKTTRVLWWLRDNPEGVVVCFSAIEATRLWNECRRLGLNIPAERFLPPYRVGEALMGRGHVKLAVDNAELVLGSLLGRVPSLMTMTDERPDMSIGAEVARWEAAHPENKGRF